MQLVSVPSCSVGLVYMHRTSGTSSRQPKTKQPHKFEKKVSRESHALLVPTGMLFFARVVPQTTTTKTTATTTTNQQNPSSTFYQVFGCTRRREGMTMTRTRRHIIIYNYVHVCFCVCLCVSVYYCTSLFFLSSSSCFEDRLLESGMYYFIKTLRFIIYAVLHFLGGWCGFIHLVSDRCIYSMDEI